MRLGIGSYTYAWSVGVPGYPPPPRPRTAERLLGKAAEVGVRVVQIADNMPLDDMTDAELDALARAASRLGIDLELGTRGCRPDRLRRYLQIAVRLGSPIVRTLLDADRHEPTPDEAVNLLRTVAPDFERAGVCLAVENHDRFPAATLADIFDRVGSAAVGLCLDTANSIGCVEHVSHLLAVLGPRIVNLHVKDYSVFRPPHHKGFIVEGQPAGQGQLDIPGLLTELQRLGRNPNVIAELWLPPEPTVAATVAKEEAWAQESVRYLRRFIPD
jgi:sugar phosphate isomerase/epimerase